MNKKIILSSVLSLVLCLSLIIGGTYALFTSNSTTNIAATSGSVNVSATFEVAELYSPTAIDLNGVVTDSDNAATTNFANGGTVTVTGSDVSITNMTPGDKVIFKVDITNNSSVAFLQRIMMSCTDADKAFFNQLVVGISDTIDGTYIDCSDYASAWEPKNAVAAATTETKYFSVEMPATVKDDWQNKTCHFALSVNAVQGNADPYLSLDKLQGEGAASLSGRIDMGELNATLTADGDSSTKRVTIGDSNLKASAVTEIVFNGGVINTPFNGNVKNTGVEHHGNGDHDGGTAHVYNEHNGSWIVLNVPTGAKVVFNNLTINGYYNFVAYQFSSDVTLEFVNCTFNGGWVGETNGLSNIIFKNCTFTLDGVDTVNVKNTNPLWLGAIPNQTLTLDGCTIQGNRPIKYDGHTNTTLNVTNCTFELTPTEYDTNANRLDRLTALRFDDNVTVGTISGNTLVSGYAFYQTNQAPYANDAYVDAANTKAEDALWRIEY